MAGSELPALFSPGSVAVVGASRDPLTVGYRILSNLKAGNYRGAILPVHPHADALLGLKCFPSVLDYDGEIELSVIAVPPRRVVDAVRESVRKGVKAVAVITAGFREKGLEGARLEEEITRICRAKGVRLLGPNCLGIINTSLGLNASVAGTMPAGGGMSVFSQSSALCTAILDEAAARGIGLAKVAGIGNKADLTEVDFLLALARDSQTRVIVGYLEDIRCGDEFVAAAEEASSIKPVIIMKGGTTDAGRRAATSHTGVLAGADIAYGAAFLRSGIIRADDYESLIDCAAALSTQPLPSGKRVLIISNAGGPGTIAADAVGKAGLEVVSLAAHRREKLCRELPEGSVIADPVLVLGDAGPEEYAMAFRLAQKDEGVDAILLTLAPSAMRRPEETARALAGSSEGTKTVLAVYMGGGETMPGRRELLGLGLPDYDSPSRAVAVLRAMEEYQAWKRRPPRVVTRFRVNRRRVERIITRRQRAGRLQIEEARSKDILRAYGFRVPDGGLATSAEEAVELSERIGYPVAAKVHSPNIVHKSDLGGVKLNLNSRAEVGDAFDLMMLRMTQRAPSARIDGIYVEKMLPQGLEVIIGMNRDPQFGPMLMFGLGGIFVEVMKDVTFHLAPVTEEEATRMLTSTRSYEILRGAGGHRKVDLSAIAAGLQRISQLATDFPQIVELDINPFMVGEAGTDPFVVDARMTLRQDESRNG